MTLPATLAFFVGVAVACKHVFGFKMGIQFTKYQLNFKLSDSTDSITNGNLFMHI